MRNNKFLSLIICLIFLNGLHAQVRPIIDNGFLGEQFWATSIHPSGNFIVKADRSVIHAHDRKNKMLFQVYQAPCIVQSIEFSPDGKLMFVNTLGEINETCNRAVVYDFYTGKILYNQTGKVIKTLGNGNHFYVKKYDAAAGLSFLEAFTFGNPGTIAHRLYYPRIDTTGTMIMDRNDYKELAGRYTPADLTSGKLPADSLPKPWRNENVRKNPLKYLQFEYHTEIQDDSLLVGDELDFSLIIDTVGFVKENNNTVLAYGLGSGRLLSTFDNAQFFGYSYVPQLNRIYFESTSGVDDIVMVDMPGLHIGRKRITGSSGHYRLMENDSNFYEVTVREKILYIRHCKDFVNEYIHVSHPFEEYELFNQGRYYGMILPDKKIIVHNKNKVIDLNDMTIVHVSTTPDTTLLHPAIVTMQPSDPHTLRINGWTWEMKSAQQFYQGEKTRYLRAADSLFYEQMVPVNNPAPWLGRVLAGHMPLYNYKPISYPFRDELSHFSNSPVMPLGEYYQNALAGGLYTNKKQTTYYVIDPMAGDSVSVEIPVIKEKMLTQEETKFREFVTRNFSEENLSKLNQFPDYTLFPFVTDDQFPITSISAYSKQNHLAWTYDPLLTDRDPKTTGNRQEAVRSLVRNLFKVSLQPRFPLSRSEYTVNIINKDYLPMLDYAGIIPENDIYYSDITFPLTDQRLLTLNYAYGIFTLKKADGTPIVQSSLYRNGEFIHVTPEGYYFASKDRLRRISLRKDNAVYPIEQFDLKYNRPDIVLARLGCTDQPTLDSYHKAYLKRLKKMGFTEDMLRDDFHLPGLIIKNRQQLPAETDSSSIELNLEIKDDVYPLDRINVLINGVPVYGVAGIDLREKNTQAINSSIRLDLFAGVNNISVSVLNGAGAESYQSNVLITHKRAGVKPNLYLVTIGDSKYADERFNLSFAAKDAEDIGTAFIQNTTGIYGEVFKYTLTNQEVSRENVLLLKEKLKKAGRNDVVMITVAGHGVLDNDFNYYLATYDMDFNDPSKKGLPYEELESLLDGIAPLKKTIFIDACHSGEVDKEEVEMLASAAPAGTGDIKFRTAGAGIRKKNLGLKTTSELMGEMFTDLRKGTGATVISSASGVEYAMESGNWQNGLFTYCLLHGLKDQQADLNHDGEIWLSELQQYLGIEVARLSKGQQQPTSRIENMSMDFRLW